MRILFKLVARELTRRRKRALLAMLAIVATGCMVVWFVGSVDLASSHGKEKLKDYFGNYTLAFQASRGFEEAWVENLSKRQEVERLDFAFQTPMHMALREGENSDIQKMQSMIGTPGGSPMLMGLETETSPFELEDGRWFQNSGECVVSTACEGMLRSGFNRERGKSEMKVGQEISLDTPSGEKILKIVGIFEMGEDFGGAAGRGGNMGTFSMGFGAGIGGQTKMGSAQPAKPDTVKSDTATSDTAKSDTSKESETVKEPEKPASQAAPPMRNRGGATAASVIVSMADAQAFSEIKDVRNMIYVRLSKNVKPAEFYVALEKETGKTLEALGIRTADVPAMEAMLAQQQSADAMVKQVWSAIGLIILASVFIIFTTLSMGVSERVRLLAMLRTLGLTRAQVAFCIVMEGVLLGLMGGVGGLLAGWILLEIQTFVTSQVWTWIPLSPLCVGIALASSLVGAVLASILPAWRATRIAPVESMVRRSRNLTNLQLTLGGLLGLAILALIPILMFVVPMSTEARVRTFSSLCTLLLAVGFFLFFPWTIVLTEKIFGPVVAWAMGLNPRFVANQLTSNQWRTLGTALALTIGLGLYTGIQIWAGSMLVEFTLTDDVPDVLVAFLPTPIETKEVFNLMEMEGVVEDDFMSLTIAQPSLVGATLEKMKKSGSMGNSVVLFGVDPQIAFREQNPTVTLDFLEGSRELALQALCDPDRKACVIAESMSERAELHVGDKILLQAPPVGRRRGMGGPGGPGGPGMGGKSGGPGGPGMGGKSGGPGGPEVGGMPGKSGKPGGMDVPKDFEYEIVGVVRFPGAPWLMKRSGVRVGEGRSAAAVFTSNANTKFDFQGVENQFFWFNMKDGIPYDTLNDRVQAIAKRASATYSHGGSSEEAVREATSARGFHQGFAQVTTKESLNDGLFRRANSVIGMMTKMPLIVLIISTIAVINTMVISVRSRRWEIGVLRAHGVTRLGIVRLVLAESILIALCACAMSFSFGLFYAWVLCGMTPYLSPFGSGVPPLLIPWSQLAFGFAAAVVVCLAASVYPAFAAGFEETSNLLQKRE